MRFVCKRAYGDQLGEAVLDLVHDTFVRCYEHAHTFSLETGVEENAEDTAPTRRNVRAWLGTIAARLFYTWLKQSKTLQLIPIDKAQKATIGTGGVEAAEGSSEDAELHPLEARLEEALARLSDAEREVLRVTFTYYRPGQAYQRLPNDISKELGDALGVSPVTVRKIRQRALEKVRAFLHQYSDHANLKTP